MGHPFPRCRDYRYKGHGFGRADQPASDNAASAAEVKSRQGCQNLARHVSAGNSAVDDPESRRDGTMVAQGASPGYAAEKESSSTLPKAGAQPHAAERHKVKRAGYKQRRCHPLVSGPSAHAVRSLLKLGSPDASGFSSTIN